MPLCVGSDSHAVIDPFVETRLVATLARAREGGRCLLAGEDGREAPVLEAVGSANGYRALGLAAGDGEDYVVLRGDDRVFDGVADEDRAAVALLGGHRGLVDRVVVGGEVIVESGRHVAGDELVG